MPTHLFHQLVRVLTRLGIRKNTAEDIADTLEDMENAGVNAITEVLEDAGVAPEVAEVLAPEIEIMLAVEAV